MEYKRPFDDEKSLTECYGEHGTNLVYLEIPYKFKLSWDSTLVVKRIRCNSLVKDDIFKALHLIFIEYGSRIERLKLNNFGGCFEDRIKRGGNELSTHAFGIALDFAPEQNRFNWDGKKALFSKPEYDRWFEIWRSVGFYSLGKEKNRDWMHIQAAIPL